MKYTICIIKKKQKNNPILDCFFVYIISDIFSVENLTFSKVVYLSVSALYPIGKATTVANHF